MGIGKSSRANSRRNRSQFWKNEVAKHGLKVEIVKTDLTWEEAIQLEQHYIKQFGRRDLKTGFLVNLTDGGEGCQNMIRTPEHNAKISSSLKNRKLSESHILKLKEKRVSEETKKKMSATRTRIQSGVSRDTSHLIAINRGRKRTEETNAKIQKTRSKIFEQKKQFLTKKQMQFLEKFMMLKNVILTCEAIGICIGTFYYWKKKPSFEAAYLQTDI